VIYKASMNSPKALLIALALTACGGGAAQTHTETAGPAATHEEAPPPAETHQEAAAPAAPPPRVRVVDACNDEAAATISASIDSDDPFVASLAYGAASAYVAVAEGRHSITIHGPEAGGNATLGLASDVLEADQAYTVFFVTQGAADAPFALYTGDDDFHAEEDGASLRFFHAIQGVDDVDVCQPGSGRGAGTPLFADVARNALGSAGGVRYADVATGEVSIQLRAHSSTVCSGRPIGTGHFTAAAGMTYTAIAIGRPSGRPRAAAQLMICSDAPAGDGTCQTVALSAH